MTKDGGRVVAPFEVYSSPERFSPSTEIPCSSSASPLYPKPCTSYRVSACNLRFDQIRVLATAAEGAAALLVLPPLRPLVTDRRNSPSSPLNRLGRRRRRTEVPFRAEATKTCGSLGATLI